MANNCQMMCVIKTESMSWTLWSHPSSKELINYGNESQGKKRSISDSHTSTHTCSWDLLRVQALPRLTIAIKNMSQWFWQGSVSHTACAYEESLRWRVGVAYSQSPPTQRDSQSAINPLPFRGQGPLGRNAAPAWDVTEWEDFTLRAVFSGSAAKWHEIHSREDCSFWDNVSVYCQEIISSRVFL